MRNPYHWLTAYTDLFYGEDRVLMVREIVSRLQRGESFAIVGGRRLGKTTLLRRLERELRIKNTGLLPIYVDAQAMPGASTPQEAFEYIRRHVSSQLRINLEGTKGNLGDWVVKAVDNVKCLKLVLLIDEFDLYREYPWSTIFFNNWRALIHNIPDVSQRLAVVLTGGRRMQTLHESPGSPLANVLAWKYLSVLDKKDALRMVNEPTQGQFGEELGETIWLETGGHPFIIQFLMHHVCMWAGQMSAQQAVELAKQKFLAEHDVVFKQWWFDHLEEDERQVYRVLRRRGAATLEELAGELRLSRIAIQERVRTLSCVGIVRRPTISSCEPAGDLFAKWVNENDIVAQGLNAGFAEYSLHQLFDELEQRVRSFVITYLKKTQGLNILLKLFPEQVEKANSNYRKSTQSEQNCPPEELLVYGDFSWPFDIMLRFWKGFYKAFPVDARGRVLGKDLAKAKQRFEERKEILTKIRNDLRHSRPVAEEDRDKARVFCRDILALAGKVAKNSDAC